MKLTFFGATRTVTGSRYLLEIGDKRILIECGLYQGRRAEWLERNARLPFDCGAIDAMLLSHAHIDHSGVIPVLTKSGFSGKIFCTDATADLCRVMLMDSAFIQEQDAEFVSKKNAKKGLPPIEPLYTQADAQASFAHFAPVKYGQPTPITDGVTSTWQDAGHMLGSAMITLDLVERGRKVRFAFSGDIGRGHNDILRDPEIPHDVDYLMMESTYGNREHEDATNVNDHICRIIARAIEQNGKVIIPSFAVGRTQQILYTLDTLEKQHRIPELPIFVDSPLAQKSNEVFRAHPECYNQKFFQAMQSADNPLRTRNLTFTESVENSMALNDFKKPCIIISASGMAEAGRIRHHIKNTVGDTRNTILIVGWCAPHTLGARLASGNTEVNIFGEPYKVRAKVEIISAFSGHADASELYVWTEKITGKLHSIFVIHGEEEAANAWSETLKKMRRTPNVIAPSFGDVAAL